MYQTYKKVNNPKSNLEILLNEDKTERLIPWRGKFILENNEIMRRC